MKNSKGKMRTAGLIALSALCLGYAIWASVAYHQDQDSDRAAIEIGLQKVAAMEDEVADREEMIDEMALAFDKIDANLEVIREKEAELREQSEGEEFMGNNQDRIVRDIQVINTLMEENKAELKRLRKKLSRSGVKVASLEERLAKMETEAEEQVVQMEALRTELAQRDVTIKELNDTLNQQEIVMALQDSALEFKEGVIVRQENQMNTAFFTTGTFKELKEKGLVEKEGDILGIGGKKTFTGHSPASEFVQIDVREHTTIPVFSKKPKLVTVHPEGSYEWNEDEEGIVSTIEITDPKSFWESSRYLIVATN